MDMWATKYNSYTWVVDYQGIPSEKSLEIPCIITNTVIAHDN